MSAIVSIGTWIAQRRRSLDLTQRELAERTNCALATVKKIEIDERRPSRELADLLADVLQIPADQKALFVECARGLRAVDALDSMGPAREAVKDNSLLPTVRIPLFVTPFIGREQELRQIAAYLREPACRLLTLVGPGGIGKTRLAYEAGAANAANFRSGAFAVPLAGVSASEYLVSSIAEHVKLNFSGSDDPKTQLISFLRTKQLLLVMDNLEHLLDGVGLLADILAAAPGVKILATSRERLNLSSEWLFSVIGLPYPTSADEGNVEGFNAVRLFEGCARRVLPSFQLAENLTASIRVCELVEGMPLAIELAASWVRRMPCAQIAEEVQRDLNFLSAGWRDVPERHRSIRALFEHSWRLLSPEEQDVLMKLSVFRGGFELAAARQIAGASLAVLTSLEDKSLVQGSPFGRFDLHELVRQYAESRQTEAGQVEETRNRHLDYFMIWAETADEQLHKVDQVAWARRIKTEYSNLRAALAWAFDGGDAEKGLRFANALWYYWFGWRGTWREGFEWIELGLRQTEGVTPVRAFAYMYAGILAAQSGNLRLALEYQQRGFEYSQELDLKDGIARHTMAMSFYLQDYAVVVAQFEKAIAILRESGPRFVLSTALFLYGDRARVQGDLDRAQALYDEGIQISQADQDLMPLVIQTGKLGRLATLKGDYQKAHHFFSEAIESARQIDSPIAISEYLIPFGRMAIYRGNYQSAEHHLKESLVWGEEFNNVGTKVHATYFLAELALHRQKLDDATQLLVDSFKLTIGDPEWRNNFTNHEFNTERIIIAGKLANALGNYPEAARLLSAGEAVRAQSGYLLDPLPRAEFEQAVQNAREQLGNGFEQAWQEGASLTEEVALRRALDYLERILAHGQH